MENALLVSLAFPLERDAQWVLLDTLSLVPNAHSVTLPLMPLLVDALKVTRRVKLDAPKDSRKDLLLARNAPTAELMMLLTTENALADTSLLASLALSVSRNT